MGLKSSLNKSAAKIHLRRRKFRRECIISRRYTAALINRALGVWFPIYVIVIFIELSYESPGWIELNNEFNGRGGLKKFITNL